MFGLNNKDIETTLSFIIKLLLWATPFSALIVATSLYFPYITGKAFFLHATIGSAFVLYLGLLLCNFKKYIPKPNPLLIAIFVFVFIVGLADLLGAYPMRSFWSNYERMEGYFWLLHLLAFVVVYSSVMVQERSRRIFWYAVFLSATVAGAMALPEVAKVQTGVVRISGPLGNPIYLAIFAVMSIFMAGVYLLREGISKTEKMLLSAFVLFELLILYFTGTRGAMLGLVVGALVAFAGSAFKSELPQRTRRIFLYGLMATTLVIISGFTVKNFNLTDNPQIQRYTQVSVSGTVAARIHAWQSAWQGIKERPLLGWGQENFNLIFNKYYNPAMYSEEMWFDRPHNLAIGWATDAGILGLLAYISVYLAFLFVLFKSESILPSQKWILFGLSVAYGIHSLTVFDNLVSALLVYAIFGWVLAKEKEQLEGKENQNKPGDFCKLAWIFILLAFVPPVFALNNRDDNKALMSALRESSLAQQASKIGRKDLAEKHTKIALYFFEQRSNGAFLGRQEAREQFSRVANTIKNLNISNELKAEFKDKAAQALKAQIAESPGALRPRYFLASLYWNFGELEKAAKEYDKMIELAPNRQIFLIKRALLADKFGELEKAIGLAKKAYELDKSNIAAGIVLLQLYQKDQKHLQEAKTLEKELKASLQNARK